MRSTTEDLVLWKQRIEERTESGMSVSKWCKVNEISKNMYHYWNRKINKKQQLDNETEFTEVTSVISNVHKSEINHWKSNDFQIFFKNIHVTVPSNFNQDSLESLMKVLNQL